jgi:hypothetical protein
MGASYQVIPMFHVTPSYPTVLARALPLVVFLSLTLLTATDERAVQAIAIVSLSAAAALYGAFSIHLLSRRKRKTRDYTVRFWRLSLSCLVLAALLLATLLATTTGVFARPAAVFLAADFPWLGYTLAGAGWLYYKTAGRISG